MSETPEPFVLYESSGRVATATLNRPASRNAIGSLADCDAVVQAVQRADADPQISVLILTGAGSSFCAGGDLKGMKDRQGIGPLATPAETRDNYRRGVQRIPVALRAAEVATIAAINGHAIGLGLDIAAICDMRVVAESARLASSFVKLGIVPGDGGAWILPRVVGYTRAAEMMLTGDAYTAIQALEMGLVNAVAPADQVLAHAQALAARIAVNPPRAVRMTKRLLREGQDQPLSTVLELSAALQALAHETADNREAIDAFIEKRPAVFIGG